MTNVKDMILALVPKTCPKCGAPTVLSDDLEHLICTNKACGGKLARSVEIFAKALEIENIGSKVAENIVNTLNISAPWEIYTLSIEDLETLPRTSKDGAKKLHSKIHARENITMAQFVQALQIGRVGAGSAQVLAEKYPAPEALLTAKAEDIAKLPKMGMETASRIADEIAQRAEEIMAFAGCVVVDTHESDYLEEVNAEADAQNGPVSPSKAPKKINAVVTGKLAYGTRSAFQKAFPLVTWQTSVTKATDILVTNKASGSSKYNKAVAMQSAGAPIQIMTEEQFMAMWG